VEPTEPTPTLPRRYGAFLSSSAFPGAALDPFALARLRTGLASSMQVGVFVFLEMDGLI